MVSGEQDLQRGRQIYSFLRNKEMCVHGFQFVEGKLKFSFPRSDPSVELIAEIKRSCSGNTATGNSKGPRHLYVTMCG